MQHFGDSSIPLQEIEHIDCSLTNMEVDTKDQEMGHNDDDQLKNFSKDQRNQTHSLSFWRGIYRHRGVLFVIIASFFSSLHFILAKYVKDEVFVTELAFLRFVLQLLLGVPLLVYKDISLKPDSCNVLMLLVARGAFGVLALTVFYFSFHFTRAGDATAVVYGSPAIIGIAAWLFLKESFDVIDAVLVVVVIVGVFLISQPPFLFGGKDGSSTQFIGIMLAVFSCLGMSATTILMRKLGQLSVNAFKIVFWYGAIAVVGTGLVTTVFRAWTVVPCGIPRYAIVGLGVLNFASQCLITYSLSLERSIFVSVLRTNEVVFTYILEFLILGLAPNTWVLIGVFVTLSASVGASLKKMWVSRRKGNARRRSTLPN